MSGDDNKFLAAIKEKKISEYTIEEIKQVLRLIMIKIGLRSQNWPDEEEKMVLIDHIQRNFAGHTGEEIKLSFDMAMLGLLSADANCYENFSCLYFSNIINAYREWAKQAYRNVEKVIINPLEQIIYSDEQILNERRREIELSYQAIRVGYYPLLHVYFEEVLRFDGLIKNDETVSEFFVKLLQLKVENIYKKQL